MVTVLDIWGSFSSNSSGCTVRTRKVCLRGPMMLFFSMERLFWLYNSCMDISFCLPKLCMSVFLHLGY